MQLLTPAIGLIFWTFIAFIIVLIILRKYAWKPILSTLKERETGIADDIASAEKMKAEMAALKNVNEALKAKAREERVVILKKAKE
jgi:F-type H+-transporting ATPase subunit b